MRSENSLPAAVNCCWFQHMSQKKERVSDDTVKGLLHMETNQSIHFDT